MKKRVISFILVLAMVICFCPVVDIQASEPLPSYNIRNDYGADVFSYFARNIANGETTQMEWSDGHQMYLGASANYINRDWISTGVNPAICSLIVFTAPYTGTVSITSSGITNHGYQWSGTYADCYAQIADTNWTNLAHYSIPATDAQTVETPEVLVNVTAGDQIRFLIGSNSTLNSYIEWVPTIAYTSDADGVHNHEWSSEWATNEAYHWHECSNAGCDIENNAEKDGYAEHTDVNLDFACDVCGACTLNYNAYDDFGTDVFSYGTRNVANGEMGSMVTNADGSMYINGANYITAAWISTGSNPAVCSVVTFTAPYAGTITINPNSIINRSELWQGSKYAESYAQIYHNSFANGIAAYNLPANDTPVVAEALVNIEVAAGDQIMFMVGSNSTLNSYVEWMPTIAYTSVVGGVHNHEWSSEWATNEEYHWHECANAGCDIENNAEKDGYAEHTDDNLDFVCDVCGACTLSYSAYDDFGTDVFSYGTRNVANGEMGTMVTNADGSMYINGGNYITAAWISTGVDPAVCSVLTFTAPYAGTITINPNSIINRGAGWSNNYAESYAQIYHNSFVNGIAAYNLPANDTPVVAEALVNIKVAAGDQIMFMVGSNSTLNSYVEWMPTVTYISMGEGTPSVEVTTEELLKPIWTGTKVYNESVMVVKNADGTIDPIQLMYPVESIDYVCDSSLKKVYQENIDYKIENGKLVILPSGSIPMTAYDEYYLQNEIPGNSFPAAQGGYLYFAEGSVFHEKQIAVTYSHSGTWQGGIPEGQAHKLPNTLEKLQNKEPLKIVFYGDSITVGANSSSFVQAEPYLPSWTELVTDALKTKYAYNDITAENTALGGAGIVWGLDNVSTLVTAKNPDLVFIGFGMNDNTDNNTYKRYISSMISAVRRSNPDCEFVLMGTMLPNSEVQQFASSNHINYVLALDEIARTGTGIAVADVTTVHSDLLNTKRYFDMTGNNVNHPNDFLARVYAQVAMQVFESVSGGVHEHQWSLSWQFDENFHWHECTADGCDISFNTAKDGYAMHTDEDADMKCDLCSCDMPLSFNALDDFGADVFSYFARNVAYGGTTQMDWSDGHQMYLGASANYINREWISTGVDPAIGSMLVFTAPYSGTVTISFPDGIVNRGYQWSGTYASNCYVSIYDSGWNSLDTYWLPENDTPYEVEPYTNIQVEAGQQFRFLVNSNTANFNTYIQLTPVITYTEITADTTHRHTWAGEWTSDGTHHWHDCLGDCTITDNADKLGYGDHEDSTSDGICDVCEAKIAGPEEGVYNFIHMFSNSQSGPWRYLTREVVTNVYKELTWDNGVWTDGIGGMIAKDWMHTSADASDKHEIQICLEFVAPKDGYLSLSMLGGKITVGTDSQNGVRFAIWKNIESIMDCPDLQAGESYDFEPIKVSVKKGDAIRFMVTAISGNNAGDAITMLPIIAYATGSDHTEHVWDEAWTSNETHHWHECVDGCEMDNDQKDGYAKHIDIVLDGACDACDCEVALPGVKNGVYSIKDMFSNSQSGPWKYLTREGVTNVYKQLKWDNGVWTDGMGGIIAKDWMHASSDASDKHEIQVCLDFVAPYDGKISLSMFGGSIDVGPDSENGIRFAVWKNNDALTPFIDLKPGESYEFAHKTVEVDKDDHIRFLLIPISGNNAGDSVVMLPIIKYTRIDYRLTPEQGFYSAMDMFSAGEQTEVWRYLKREAVSNTYSELTWNNGIWIDGMGGIIAKDWMHASADASDKHEIQVCLQFVAPSDGQIELGMEDDVITVGSDSSNGVRVGITHNGTFIYGYSDLRAGSHSFARMKLNITKGDTLNFLLIPISGNNEGDSCGFVPWIQYHSYEKAPEPELEVRPDDPSKTYYNSTDDYGGYLNPWYYCYSTVGAQKLNAMSWGAQGGFFVPELPGLSISDTGAHPYPGYNAIRLFRVPKSGTIRITMNDGAISLPNGTSGAEDGVYVSIQLNNGSSVSEAFKRTLVLPGEVMKFEQIEMKIYEGWELWFVVHCNTNNANDSVTFAPVIEYLEITDEKAPVISNREETLTVPSLEELYGNGSDKSGDGLNILWIVIAFAVTAVVANGVILLVVAKGKKKQK